MPKKIDENLYMDVAYYTNRLIVMGFDRETLKQHPEIVEAFFLACAIKHLLNKYEWNR